MMSFMTTGEDLKCKSCLVDLVARIKNANPWYLLFWVFFYSKYNGNQLLSWLEQPQMQLILAAWESTFVNSQGCYISVKKSETIFLCSTEKSPNSLEIWAQ